MAVLFADLRDNRTPGGLGVKTLFLLSEDRGIAPNRGILLKALFENLYNTIKL